MNVIVYLNMVWIYTVLYIQLITVQQELFNKTFCLQGTAHNPSVETACLLGVLTSAEQKYKLNSAVNWLNEFGSGWVSFRLKHLTHHLLTDDISHSPLTFTMFHLLTSNISFFLSFSFPHPDIYLPIFLFISGSVGMHTSPKTALKQYPEPSVSLDSILHNTSPVVGSWL